MRSLIYVMVVVVPLRDACPALPHLRPAVSVIGLAAAETGTVGDTYILLRYLRDDFCSLRCARTHSSCKCCLRILLCRNLI